MQYRTEISIRQDYPQFSPQDCILMMGSCFSDNIGGRLAFARFSVQSNPLGICYNPLSIFKHIDHYLLNEEVPDPSDLDRVGELFSHPDFHSEFNSTQAEEVIHSISNRLKETNQFLTQTKILFVTMGSAWAYQDKKSNNVVANCHRRPAAAFNKKLLSLEEMITVGEQILSALNMPVILTVSPVRHIKDGMIENSRSKARLIELCHLLTQNVDNCYYFPSYEIMVDDLRDYRFYARDMLHPSDLAIDYIWEKFRQCFMNMESISFYSDQEKLSKMLDHVPRFPGGNADIQHKGLIQRLIEEFKVKYPFVDYSAIEL